ncbi:hypothetical protein GGX14DRAFT_388904 [Mycena pura]|uniref:Uncharacterized protein n=1 Tax=Mycena pura TaxID=153505 RepID=A0AAD6YKI7_9AGAR|nr:hypothetical protein GGX14DRAFT_388904 [Mycena pura]
MTHLPLPYPHVNSTSPPILPKGNKLIIRGAYIADSTNHDPVRLVQKAVDHLKVSVPSLTSVPVVVIPFSEKFQSVSTAYMVLHPSLASMEPEAEPRCDLLELWMQELRVANTTWEITWAPASEGSDKRMWCRFPTLVLELAKKLDRQPTKDDDVKCLTDILKANNILIENVFAMGTKGGMPPQSAAAVLINPRQVDTLQRHRQINTHSLLPDAIQVDRVKQVEILNPFELAIVGISAYESIEPLILSYLLEFEDEDGQQLASTRNPQGYRDILVFHMSTWAATKRVLKDHEGFDKAFGKYNLNPPELLIDINEGKVAWKANAVSEGADKLAAKMDTLTRHFDKVERDVGLRLDATHLAIADLKSSSNVMAEQLRHLACESSLRMLMMLGGTQEEKEQARANIEILKADCAKIDNEISVLQGSTLLIPSSLQSYSAHTSGSPLSSPHSPAEPEVYHSPPDTPTAQSTGSKKHRLSSDVPDEDSMMSAPPRSDVTGGNEEQEVENMTTVINEDSVMEDQVVRSTHSQNVPIFPKKATALYLVLIIVCSSLIQVANATTPRSVFTMFSLNANGLVHTNKMAHINTAINARKPHAFILNESKTNSKIAKNLPGSDYEILEEAGVKMTNHHLYKWGVVLGVRKDVQLIQRLTDLDAALKGRVIAADIALQTTNGTAYPHRLFAVYAPWDPGTNDTKEFWPANLSRTQTRRVSTAERASGGGDARDKFLAFLEAVDGHDLWTGRPDRNRFYDWTSSSHDAEKNGGSIIDRIVTSKETLIDSEIFVTNGGTDFVPNTNHCAIVARIIHEPLTGGNTMFRDTPAVYTKIHEEFKRLFDESATREGLFDMPCVNSDESFISLYKAVGRVMLAASEVAYRRISRFKKRTEKVTNEKIQKAAADLHAIGGAIRLIRGDVDFTPSCDSEKALQKITQLYDGEEGHGSLISFANKIKRKAYSTLYAERAAEVKARAVKRDKSQIITALRGGSTKRLVTAANFVLMPLVVKAPHTDRLTSKPEEVKEVTRQYWSDLYNHDPPPNIPKPWLNTKSWPKPAQLHDLRALLRKGNARPAPGPDEWENSSITSSCG